jgi:hypothetical protein
MRKISVILDAKSVRRMEFVRHTLASASGDEARCTESRAVRAALRAFAEMLANKESEDGK